MPSQAGPAQETGLKNAGAHIIHIKRKRKDPPVDSLYLEQQVEDQTPEDGVVKPRTLSRKLRRTQFMYQRVSPAEIALFDAVPSLPALPEPAVIATHHKSNVDPMDLPSSSIISRKVAEIAVQALPKRKRMLPRRWVAAPVTVKDGERTFMLERRNEQEMDLDDPDSKTETSSRDTNPGQDTLDDYVWDVLVRTNINNPHFKSGADVLTIPLVGANTARLIITRTDEAELLGDIYQSDGEDEDKVETDDEDENAEDYYGADYPDEEEEEEEEQEEDEDEDEYGGGNYYHGSDDEEFGGSGAGYYNEETGRFSKTKYLNTYNDEVRSAYQ